MTTEEQTLREPTDAEIEEAKSILKGLDLFPRDDQKVRWIAACIRFVRAGVPLVKVPKDEGLQ
jgi:hypothetical protein